MALRDQPYIPLYVLDFLSDEKLRECSAESAGVYIMLMCVMHKSEVYGTITLRDKYKQNGEGTQAFADMLHRQLPYETEVIKRSLDELLENGVLTKEYDIIYQKRMVRDAELSTIRAEVGAKGGKRNSKKSTSDTADAEVKSKQMCRSKTEAKVLESDEAKLKQTQGSKIEANYENEIEIENEYKNEDVKEKSVVEERFDVFWKAYPRKAGKGEARRAFLKKVAPDKELFERIMSAVERAKQCEQWQKDGGQFIPYPATWLNQERWDDDYGGTGQDPPEDAFDPDDPYAAWRDGT